DARSHRCRQKETIAWDTTRRDSKGIWSVKRFVWEPVARNDLRRLDRTTAMRILLTLTQYGKTGAGDVKALTDRGGLYRLRVGKWRVFFDLDDPDEIRIHGIDNRGETY